MRAQVFNRQPRLSGRLSSLSDRAKLLVASLLFWLVWFTLARVLFLAYQGPLTRALTAPLITGAFVHGARMDLATAAYLTAIPWVLLLLTVRAPAPLLKRALTVYLAVAAAFVTVLMAVDLAVYAGWRIRLDATPLQFLRTPREMAASSAASPYVRLILLIVLLSLATFRLARRWIAAPAAHFARAGVASTLAGVAAGGGLFVLARGGTQWTPLNQSTVFFSENDFANQAALNPGWTFVHGVLSASQLPRDNPYRLLSARDVRQTLDSLVERAAGHPTRFLRTARPNVILLVWESATAKVMAPLGGLPGVTPEFQRLAHEGVLFDSIFASGERSAQGLVALLSAYPALPHQQLMNVAHKIDSLPMLSRMLGGHGYHTSFYYGGELAFANIKSYVLASRYDRIVGEDSFARADRNSKWGAHDHVVLGRLLHDLAREPHPFFSSLFTLSSHEPFEVPVPPVFPGSDEETLFLNAQHYTDRSIAEFVRAAAQQPWWDSTLVVIIADHGHLLPAPKAGVVERVPDRFHIPMLWLGGALAIRDTVVHAIGSQIDVMPMVLGQLGLGCPSCRWAKDLLRPGERGFAYFAYRDGFAFIDPTGWLVYDVLARRAVERVGDGQALRQRRGAALLQDTFDDFLSR